MAPPVAKGASEHPPNPTTKRKKLEVTTAANPQRLRTRVTHTKLPPACPIGLSSGSSCALYISHTQTLGLATPNICYLGHLMPTVAFLGRRRHSLDKSLVLYRTMRLLMSSIFAVRHIGCCRYDTTLSGLHNCLWEARSRPFVRQPSPMKDSPTAPCLTLFPFNCVAKAYRHGQTLSSDPISTPSQSPLTHM